MGFVLLRCCPEYRGSSYKWKFRGFCCASARLVCLWLVEERTHWDHWHEPSLCWRNRKQCLMFEAIIFSCSSVPLPCHLEDDVIGVKHYWRSREGVVAAIGPKIRKGWSSPITGRPERESGLIRRVGKDRLWGKEAREPEEQAPREVGILGRTAECLLELNSA